MDYYKLGKVWVTVRCYDEQLDSRWHNLEFKLDESTISLSGSENMLRAVGGGLSFDCKDVSFNGVAKKTSIVCIQNNLTTKFYECPGCGYLVLEQDVYYASHDFLCNRCNKYKLSDFRVSWK